MTKEEFRNLKIGSRITYYDIIEEITGFWEVRRIGGNREGKYYIMDLYNQIPKESKHSFSGFWLYNFHEKLQEFIILDPEDSPEEFL